MCPFSNPQAICVQTERPCNSDPKMGENLPWPSRRRAGFANFARFLNLRDKSGAAKRYNQVEERATLKILPFQPLANQHRAEVVYRVLLENLDALYSTAKRLTGRADLAEDLVQETARKALQAIPALTDERNTRAWLFRILMNGVRDQARRKKLWAEVDADEETPDLNAISESVEGATAEDVRRALSSLPPETRSLAILIDIQEFTIAEAAAMLQIPPGTAASRLSRARRELRGLLHAYRSGSSRSGGKS